MNNFAVFLENLGDKKIAPEAYDLLNRIHDKRQARDVSLFYENPGHEPKGSTFGLFNSTETWHFSGDLLVTFLDGLHLLKNTVNKQNVIYYYGLEDDLDLFGLISGLDQKLTIVARSEDHAKELYRKTGRKADSICMNLAEFEVKE